MKIGIDIRATQLGGSGERGIGRYTYDLVHGLAKEAPENEYILIATPEHPIPAALPFLPSCCRIAMLPTRFMGDFTWGQPIPKVWRLRYLRFQKEHEAGLRHLVQRERLDVIHLTSSFEPRFFAGVNVHCPVVMTLYDLIPLAFKDEIYLNWPEATRYVYQLQLASFRRANAVAAISESARQDGIKHIGLSPDRVHVVPCTIASQFTPFSDEERGAARTQCRERFGLRHPFFLFCSGAGFTKNRDRVLEAFARFADQHSPNYHLVFTGPSGGDEDRLRLMAFNLGLSAKQFVLAGYVSNEELVTLFGGALALVTPSLYEGFGLPAAQAMRMGTPVIASDRSSHPEVVGDAGLQVDPYNVEAIMQAMLQIAKDSGLRARLSQAGQQRAERFRPENQARALLDVYQKAVAASEPPERRTVASARV